MKEVLFRVDGMRCGMCESHVCDQIRKIPGVKSAKASHRKGLAKAIVEDDCDIALIEQNILSQGYRVDGIEIAPYKKKGLFGK